MTILNPITCYLLNGNKLAFIVESTDLLVLSLTWTGFKLGLLCYQKSCQGQTTYAEALLNALKMSVITATALKDVGAHFHTRALKTITEYHQELQGSTWFIIFILKNKKRGWGQKTHLTRASHRLREACTTSTFFFPRVSVMPKQLPKRWHLKLYNECIYFTLPGPFMTVSEYIVKLSEV